jgi:hypothetical protein
MFSQNDKQWNQALMDPNSKRSYCTIGSVGCAIASAAMVVAHYGVKVRKYVINANAPRTVLDYNAKWKYWTNKKCTGIGKNQTCTGTPPSVLAGYGMNTVGNGTESDPLVSSMDPLSLDAYLLKHGDMNGACNLSWTGRAWNYMMFKNTRIRFKATYSGSTQTHRSYYTGIPDLESGRRGRGYLATIENELRARRPVIGMVGGKGDGKVDHFVVITGDQNGDFVINDPSAKQPGGNFFQSKFGGVQPYQLWGIVTMHYVGPKNS